MTPETFDALAAQGYNRIPVVCEVLADLDTPLSVYLKLAEGPNSFLLESVHGGEKWGRYSIIGLPCRTLLKVSGRQVSLVRDGEVIEAAEVEDPLAWIHAFQGRFLGFVNHGRPFENHHILSHTSHFHHCAVGSEVAGENGQAPVGAEGLMR